MTREVHVGLSILAAGALPRSFITARRHRSREAPHGAPKQRGDENEIEQAAEHSEIIVHGVLWADNAGSTRAISLAV